MTLSPIEVISMPQIQDEDLDAKLQRYRSALDALIDRIKQDRWVLAVVLVGSLNEETIWRKEGIGLWIVEADGVTRRRRSDGEEHRIWRTLVEKDVNFWAELIPRSRFKRMVEGSSRTAFSYNFFARRQLIYSADESLTGWFEEANGLAIRDQNHELLITTCWVVHELDFARKVLALKGDINRTWQALFGAAHALAAAQIVRAGEICETHALRRALELHPELFAVVYTSLLTAGPDEAAIRRALASGEAWLDETGYGHMEPILRYLRKQNRAVPLSELADHFAYSQLYPWHLESACEWLVRTGRLEKLAAEMPLTKKSRFQVEEPAYFFDAT